MKTRRQHAKTVRVLSWRNTDISWYQFVIHGKMQIPDEHVYNMSNTEWCGIKHLLVNCAFHTYIVWMMTSVAPFTNMV